MKKQIITTFVIIVISSLLIGQNSRMGSASSTQLLVVPSAKHLSGGGAAATATGMDAAFWNPAGWANSENNIDAIYDKKKLNDDEIKNLILDIRENKISGINVTVPFKNKVIPFLDELSLGARQTQSVNTIFMKDNKVIGDNTDIGGFESAIKKLDIDLSKKTAFILGAGGVVPSIIYALFKMGISKILISNRTETKAENIKKLFNNIQIVSWGEIPEFDIIINGTSLGLDNNDQIDLDFSKVGKNKLFYDVIYNPNQTNFLKTAKQLGNKFENGKLMFIFQALLSFKLWHNLEPEVNDKTIKLLDVW